MRSSPAAPPQKLPPSCAKALLCASVFSAYEECFEWFERSSSKDFGEIAARSPRFEFTETEYYRAEMGEGLHLSLYVFSLAFNPDSLAEFKRISIALEQAARANLGLSVARPINIDAGYLTGAKFVLASTKDGSHRISIGQGLFAEIELIYRYGEWHDLPWTYPNYRRADYKSFLSLERP